MNYSFTLHQLTIFGEVVKYNSITRAAEALHMTQPAVSIQLKKLQEALDVELIQVIGKKLHLTEAGEELYHIQQELNERFEGYEAFISQLKGGLKGKLAISAASTAKYFLPYLLGEFQKKYPLVDISLKVTNRNEVLEHLNRNEFNLAILTQVPSRDDLEAIPFLENPLVMAAPPGHPLRDQNQINVRDLREETFIFREPGSGTRMVMEEYLAKHGLRPNVAMELGTNEAVKQAIMAGIGVSLISELSLGPYLEMDRICILDVQGTPISTQWHILYHKGRTHSPATKNFIGYITSKHTD